VLFWVPASFIMSRVGLEGLEVFVRRWKWDGEKGSWTSIADDDGGGGRRWGR
jgi:hypothetical protein